MQCQGVRRLLDEYRDGELAGARLQQVAAHLAACRECAGELGRREAISGLLHGWDQAGGDAALTERVVSLWGARRPGQQRAARRRRMATLFAAGAGAAALTGAGTLAVAHLAKAPRGRPAGLHAHGWDMEDGPWDAAEAFGAARERGS